jgi:hypothetical protein
MLCCSKKNAGTIYFTVNLKSDDYHYEEGELEDKMYLCDRQEWLHFDLSTSAILRNTVAHCQPKLKRTSVQSRRKSGESCDKVAKGKSIPILQSLGKGVSSKKKRVACWQPQKNGGNDGEYHELAISPEHTGSTSPPMHTEEGRIVPVLHTTKFSDTILSTTQANTNEQSAEHSIISLSSPREKEQESFSVTVPPFTTIFGSSNELIFKEESDSQPEKLIQSCAQPIMQELEFSVACSSEHEQKSTHTAQTGQLRKVYIQSQQQVPEDETPGDGLTPGDAETCLEDSMTLPNKRPPSNACEDVIFQGGSQPCDSPQEEQCWHSSSSDKEDTISLNDTTISPSKRPPIGTGLYFLEGINEDANEQYISMEEPKQLKEVSELIPPDVPDTDSEGSRDEMYSGEGVRIPRMRHRQKHCMHEGQRRPIRYRTSQPTSGSIPMRSFVGPKQRHKCYSAPHVFYSRRGHCVSSGMQPFPVMELFKNEVVLLLSDSKYDWLTCARLLDISGSSQLEIEHSYPAKRQLFDVIDAFQFDKKVHGSHTPNVDSLLKELQGKLPQDLSDQLCHCLEKAIQFTPPTLEYLPPLPFEKFGKPQDSLLQSLALSSTSLRNETYIVARLLGLSRDDVTECEGEARFAVNKAVRFTEGILFKWKRKCPKDGCTTLALFQVLAFLDIHLQDVNGVIWQPNCTSV